MSELTDWGNWKTEDSSSGWGSFWDRSPVGSWFYASEFRDVSGTVPEFVRTCGFKRNSSSLDRAAKMRDSVLMNSRDSFLATMPSVSSETRDMYSSFILGKDVFGDWPLLGCSFCVSLTTAANFLFFLNVAIFWTESNQHQKRLNYFFLLFNLKEEQECDFSKWATCRNLYSQLIIIKVIILISNLSTFVSPINTFPLAGSIIFYKPSQGTKLGRGL